MTFATAPGKVILFGEHAVVFGRPALAVPVLQVNATVTVEDREPAQSPSSASWLERISLDAPQVGRSGSLADYPSGPSPDPLAFVIRSVLDALTIEPAWLHIRVDSTIPVASGLGSGAAVSVALIRALSNHLGQPLSDQQVNQIAFEAEKLHHGTPSGIDNTVITYSQPVFFIKGTPIQTFSVGKPFSLLIADSGIPAATRDSVADVRRLWEGDHDRLEVVFSCIGGLVMQARSAIRTGDLVTLGNLMTRNHALLHELTVSSPELDRLVQAALGAGALGAKLSGGGRGGNMLALVQEGDQARVEQALKSAGSRSVLITCLS